MVRVLQVTDVCRVVLGHQVLQDLVVAVVAGDVEGRVARVVHGSQVGVGVEERLDDEESSGAVFRSAGHEQRRVAVL